MPPLMGGGCRLRRRLAQAAKPATAPFEPSHRSASFRLRSRFCSSWLALCARQTHALTPLANRLKARVTSPFAGLAGFRSMQRPALPNALVTRRPACGSLPSLANAAIGALAALQDVRMYSQTRLRHVRCAIRSCPAGLACGLLRRIRDVGSAALRSRPRPQTKRRQPGPCTRLSPLGNLRSAAFHALVHRARHELGALDAEALRDALGAEAAPELVVADLEPAAAAFEL